MMSSCPWPLPLAAVASGRHRPLHERQHWAPGRWHKLLSNSACHYFAHRQGCRTSPHERQGLPHPTAYANRQLYLERLVQGLGLDALQVGIPQCRAALVLAAGARQGGLRLVLLRGSTWGQPGWGFRSQQSVIGVMQACQVLPQPRCGQGVRRGGARAHSCR